MHTRLRFLKEQHAEMDGEGHNAGVKDLKARSHHQVGRICGSSLHSSGQDMVNLAALLSITFQHSASLTSIIHFSALTGSGI
jgi:hypothetical protein